MDGLLPGGNCKQCGILYLPYAQGKGGMEEVASFFVCRNCYLAAETTLLGLRKVAHDLEDRGVHPRIVNSIMEEKVKKLKEC